MDGALAAIFLDGLQGGGGGATEWSELLNKPFETIGDNLGVTPDQALYAKVPIAESLTNSEIEELLK